MGMINHHSVHDHGFYFQIMEWAFFGIWALIRINKGNYFHYFYSVSSRNLLMSRVKKILVSWPRGSRGPIDLCPHWGRVQRIFFDLSEFTFLSWNLVRSILGLLTHKVTSNDKLIVFCRRGVGFAATHIPWMEGRLTPPPPPQFLLLGLNHVHVGELKMKGFQFVINVSFETLSKVTCWAFSSYSYHQLSGCFKQCFLWTDKKTLPV